MPLTGGGQTLLLHVVPSVHDWPLPTHRRSAGSQQPVPQSAPLQHASPGAPHATH
jgi:hypothetical protein